MCRCPAGRPVFRNARSPTPAKEARLTLRSGGGAREELARSSSGDRKGINNLLDTCSSQDIACVKQFSLRL